MNHRFYPGCNTFLQDQFYVCFVVIKPSRDLQPAAVDPSITLLSVRDGQGDVSVCHPAQHLVTGGFLEPHRALVRGEDGVGAFGHGHAASSPAETQDAISLEVVQAGQSHIVSI